MTRRVGKITRVISYDHHEEENRAGLSCDNIAIARKDFNFPETKLIPATRVLQVRSMAVDPHQGVLPCSHVCGLSDSSL